MKIANNLDFMRVSWYNQGMDKAAITTEELVLLLAEKEAQIAELKNEKASLEDKNAKINAENAKLKLLNETYLEQLRLARHRLFGRSSERTELPEQLGLFNEVEILADAAPEEEKIAYTRKKRKGKREEFYEGLPCERIIHELSEDERICPDCGDALHACGQSVLRREVKIIPAQVNALEHVQAVYSCRRCERTAADDPVPMIKASVPPAVIPGSGIASASLLSFIISNKYVLALPLARQEKELGRIGLHISRQTMANWVIYAANRYLEPMYRLLYEELLRSEILHADESTVQVVRESGRKASQKSYMWMYHTGKDTQRQVALLEYQPSRQGKHPQAFLEGFRGYLHVDAYSGYKALEDRGVTLVECWSHMRRKFEDALKSLAKDARKNAKANIGAGYCNQIFALEREFDEQKLSFDERKEARVQKSKPVCEAFFAWVKSEHDEGALAKNALSTALVYAINQERWLTNFLLDGRLEVSNNRAERSIRPFTVGRKNWLFSFSEKGAKASAIAYSIVETAQANGLVPFLYLNYLFEKLPYLPADRFHECLPCNVDVQAACAIPIVSAKV